MMVLVVEGSTDCLLRQSCICLGASIPEGPGHKVEFTA